MDRTKNQHFVPQFYLRNFSRDKKTIGTYVLEKNLKVDKASIKNQASKNYLYSSDQEIENILGTIEADASRVIKSILENPKQKLNEEQIFHILSYMIIQMGRTPAMSNELQNSIEDMYKMVLMDRIRKRADYTKDREKGFEDYLSSFRLKIVEPNLMAVSMYASFIQQVLLQELDYKILLNDTDENFITGDNPVCMYNQFRERMKYKNYSIAMQGVELFMPISPKVAFLFYDPFCYKIGERKKHHIEVSRTIDIQELNKLVVCYAEKVIFFLPCTKTQSSLQNLSAMANHYKVAKHDKISTIQGEKGKVYIIDQKISMYCKLTVSFIKETRQNKRRSRGREEFSSNELMRRYKIYT